jgi:hypothetical protein
MSRNDSRNPNSGVLIAIALGAVGGLLVIGLSLRDQRFEGGQGASLAIHINGIEERMSRDVLLPNQGWVLQVELPPDLPASTRESLQVTLRAERTGAMIEIADQLNDQGNFATLVIPESLGLYAGLLSVRATLTDDEDHELVAYRRVRIRRWLGGPPIGSRQIIHFDFGVDRDGDGRPDFERDLERFGLASPERPDLAKIVAEQISERALARVARAYDAQDDPNQTGHPRDQVFVRFLLDVEPGPFVTRICVGGANAAHPRSVGNVRFDLRNERKSSNECERRDDDEAAGLFPAELNIYEEAPLYSDALGPFLAAQGGIAVGLAGADEEALEEAGAASKRGADDASPAPPRSERSRAIAHAIALLGDVLGTIMAHESAHALGLVPAGRPGVGLFGGAKVDGELYAHNTDPEGNSPSQPWLMNLGREFGFEELAGRGESGELQFRSLNYAYLRDRVVLIDERRP